LRVQEKNVFNFSCFPADYYGLKNLFLISVVSQQLAKFLTMPLDIVALRNDQCITSIPKLARLMISAQVLTTRP
jgi:hypothetical protein